MYNCEVNVDFLTWSEGFFFLIFNFAPKIFFLDSIISPQKNLGIELFQIYLLQTPPALSTPPAPPDVLK